MAREFLRLGSVFLSHNYVYLMMTATALFWSGAFIAGKLSVAAFSPLALTFFRFFFALPFIFIILFLRQPHCRLPNGKQWPALVLLGTLGTYLYHILFFSSLQYTTAVNASLIGATNPMFTALFGVFLFKEKITVHKTFGFIISFIGVFLIITDGQWDNLQSLRVNKGDFIMFAAVWCWALYSLFSRNLMSRYHISPVMTTAYTFLVCTLVSGITLTANLPWSAIHWNWNDMAQLVVNRLYPISIATWLSILYMAIFASVLGYLFQLSAIEVIGAPNTNIFINLVPVFTAIQSVLILGEAVSVFKIISACFIIFGVYITTRPQVANQANA